MSKWTHIIGSFYIDTNEKTEDLKSYIEEQLKFAPKITGSESNIDIFVNPLSGYNTSVMPDCDKCKYKNTLRRSKTNGYLECDADNGYHCPEGNYQTCAVVTIVGDLRDRDAEITISETESFIDYLNSPNDIYYASVTITDEEENIWDFKFNPEDILQSIWERRK